MSLFSRSRRAKTSGAITEYPAVCSHREIAPRWDTAAHIGDETKATYFVCTNCDATFTPEQAKAIEPPPMRVTGRESLWELSLMFNNPMFYL